MRRSTINNPTSFFSILPPESNQVLFEENSGGRKVVLNRTQKLNCLTYDMISKISKALKEYEEDRSVKVVILKGKGKAFCAGGDVLSVVSCSTMGHWSFAAIYYKKQLLLDYLIGTYKKPLVSLINGIVMGGGAGLSLHGRFRIVTENTIFAMPEASIGLFPDVGASHFLSRLPGSFGEYLGLTGAKIGGSEMLACGLATHFVLSKDLHLLENALCEVTSSNISIISNMIDRFTHKVSLKQDSAYARLDVINKCFSRKTVEEILESLENEVKNGAQKWLIAAISSLKSASPMSLKVTLRVIREGRKERLKECLIRDYIISSHMLRRTINGDFYEGARAMLIEKDKNPKWEPSKLELVSKEMVDRCFVAPEDDHWENMHFPYRACPSNMYRPRL
ncbi:3-hydroxyisobutyryl-CoA hydrolase 1-like [Malania oleifera]|uniref:3-hydroxyisobutyryl-CoA hydrolase 1-like n=1 Tax=Malania oleifera TaxID=397392 RepID=UPI0025ADF9CB|nr:3-hydroxyisobutyryl-CoA hydrolase 1-like [Malania oleifera]